MKTMRALETCLWLPKLLLALSLANLLPATEVSGTVHVKAASGHESSTVIVYAESLDQRSPVHPGQYEIVQKNKTFVPHVLAVPMGSNVTFPNSDPIFHNVFSLSSPLPFDLGLYRAGSSKNLNFDRPAVYHIFCNIHPQMAALLLVLPTSWIAQADEKGAFHFDLPPGRYRITAWSEHAVPASTPVTVGSNRSTISPLLLDESTFVETLHKNKFGQDYPRSAYEQANH